MVLIPEGVPGSGSTSIEYQEKSASITGVTGRCHAKTGASMYDDRRGLLIVRG
jgi:hypothetical protein